MELHLPKAVRNAEEALSGSLESDFERGFYLPEAKDHKGNGYYKIHSHSSEKQS